MVTKSTITAAGSVRGDGGRLEQLRREAELMFDGIKDDPTKPVMFGFIATLAIAELARHSLADAEKGHLALFDGWSSELLRQAVTVARSVAATRLQSQRAFNAGVWHVVANGIEAQEIDSASVEAKTIRAGIAQFIDLYAEAPEQKLTELGLDGPVAMVDPRRVSVRQRQSRSPTLPKKNDHLGLAGGQRFGLTPAIRNVLSALAIFVGLTALAWLGMSLLAELSGARARNAAFNPAITQAFRAIESRCMAENPIVQTVRCKQALETFEGCYRSTDSCLAEKVYCVLDVLQFDLPNYYRPGTAYQHENPC